MLLKMAMGRITRFQQHSFPNEDNVSFKLYVFRFLYGYLANIVKPNGAQTTSVL